MKKNKKNGFTLVELLAVIAILGLVLIVAVPKINKTMNNSKKKTFGISAKSIAKSAEERYIENETYEIDEEITCESVSNISKKDFSSCKINFDDEGNATVTIIGAGSYEGLYICNGTKTNAEVSEGSCTGLPEQTDNISPGLYETGSNYQKLLKDWDTIINEGFFYIDNGELCVNYEKSLEELSISFDLKLPDDGSITSIGDHVFSYITSLTGVIIPKSVTIIREFAFVGCSNLTSITIPNSVTSIEDGAFSECSSLTSITIPDSVTSIGYSAFSECSSLTSITIPKSVTSIGYSAFSGCSSLTSINIDNENNKYASMNGVLYSKDLKTLHSYPGGKAGAIFIIPNGVTSIGEYAFSECSNLTSVTIPEGVTSIGYSAFSECSNLTSITIPESVTSIGHNAFSRCSNLTSIIIPEGVTSIESSVFYGCSNLTSVTIPESVTSIGSEAFAYSGLTSITIPEGVTSIGDGAFKGCSSLTSITIPEGVTSIGGAAFARCDGLTDIIIPSNVTNIEHRTFDGCSNLTSIRIPKSVTSVGYSAFSGCSSLYHVEYVGSQEEWDSITIEEENSSLINADKHFFE